jgi:hypothetical protein
MMVDIDPTVDFWLQPDGAIRFSFDISGGCSLSDGDKTVSYSSYTVIMHSDRSSNGMYFEIVGQGSTDYIHLMMTAPGIPVPAMDDATTVQEGLAVAQANATLTTLGNYLTGSIWVELGVSSIEIVLP